MRRIFALLLIPVYTTAVVVAMLLCVFGSEDLVKKAELYCKRKSEKL